jgi:short-subunit dehydrogenase
MTDRRPITLITGASGGIGAELAQVFAANGHELMLVARRQSKMVALADLIEQSGKPRPTVLPLDLTRRDAAQRIGDELGKLGLEPEYVVNNAGYGLIGQASELDRDDQLAMIDLNVRVLTELSLTFLASLERRRGGILNVASVAGFMSGPGMAVYYATKGYVVSFSEALHRELAPKGVRVTALCPAAVPTEFQPRAGIDITREPAIFTRHPSLVALAGYRGFMRGRRVVVPGFACAVAGLAARYSPRSWTLPAVARHNSKAGRRSNDPT